MRKLVKDVFSWIDACFNRWVIYSNNIEVGRNLVIHGRLYVNNQGKIVIGNDVTINSGERYNPVGGQTRTRLIVYRGGRLQIGDGAGISNTTIVAQTLVDIGEGALIGGSCNIWDTDFHSVDPNIRGTEQDQGRSRPIFFGNKSFIGAHSIILKGSVVGNCSIVRAGSVVSTRVPDGETFRG